MWYPTQYSLQNRGVSETRLQLRRHSRGRSTIWCRWPSWREPMRGDRVKPTVTEAAESWRSMICEPGSSVALRDSPSTLEQCSKEAIIAEAKWIVDVRCTASSRWDCPRFRHCCLHHWLVLWIGYETEPYEEQASIRPASIGLLADVSFAADRRNVGPCWFWLGAIGLRARIAFSVRCWNDVDGCWRGWHQLYCTATHQL